MTVSIVYRPEVDGLRALAVLPVILFHAGVDGFGGGFVGVDVFFVISGYLITSIIVEDLAQGRFTIVGFYERRARRILPALLLVMAACVPFARLWMLPDELIDFGHSLAAAALFGSNVLFWRETGYFSAAAELQPLLHTWSLAIEEQFYLLYPLVLMLVWRLRRRRVFAVVAAVTVASLGLAHWTAIQKPAAAFFLLPTRAWELGIGACVALHLRGDRLPRRPRGIDQAQAMLGLVLIAGSIVLFDQRTPNPSLHTLGPTVGTALILLSAWPHTIAGRILSHCTLVFLGRLSYSAYLWHQPLLAFARIESLDKVGTWTIAGLLVATAAMSWLSWRFIETPCRHGLAVPRRALVAGSLGLAALGTAIALGTDNPTPSVREFASGECKFYKGDCYERAKASIRVALWGDSHAGSLATNLGRTLNERGISLSLFVMQSCPSLPGTIRNEPRRLGAAFGKQCSEHNAAVVRRMTKSNFDYLVLSSAYEWYMTGRNAAGEPVLLDPEANGTDPAGLVSHRLAQVIESATREGIEVIVVTPHPLLRNSRSVRKAVFRHLHIEPEFDVAAAVSARKALLADPDARGLPYIEIAGTRLYCDDGACRVSDSAGRFYLFDGSHFAPPLSHAVAARILDAIERGRRAE